MSLLPLVIWLSLPAYALFFISREQASRGKYCHNSSTYMLEQNYDRSDTMIKKLVRTGPMLFEQAADYVLVDCLLRQYWSSYKVIPAFD